jgi:hypothetical protein
MDIVGDRTEPEAEVQLRSYADELVDGIERALPRWVVASVERLVLAYHGSLEADVTTLAREAGERARADTVPRLLELLSADVEEQWTNPLALVRRAVVYPTEVLRRAGVPPVVRDEHAERLFPDDPYDLTPARFADLDPALHEVGLRWGAAKAFVVKARRGGERE